MMRMGMSLLAVVALCAANMTVAYADPPPWAHGHDRHDDHDRHDHDDHDHDHWDDRHDRDDHHDHGHYVRERVVVRERIYVMPWRGQAPAPAPYGIAQGTCNRQLLGAVIGGGTGAVVGSRIGKGTGRLVAVAGGAILGVLAGGAIGQAMDEVDQNCIGQALEHANDGRSVIWRDSVNNQQYTVSPVQTFQAEDGRYCREYTTTAVVAGRHQQVYGTACRQPDGSWQIVG